MSRSWPAEELAFGAAAQALNPLACGPGYSPGCGQAALPGEPDAVWLRLSSQGLAKADRAALESLPSARLRSLPGRPGSTGELFTCERDELAGLTRELESAAILLHAHDSSRRLRPERPLIWGVLNVTPDSFSDGGRFLAPERAIEQGLRLVEEGANLIDVGGESTRPGAEPVPVAEELERVLPVIAGLAQRSDAALGIDTIKSEVARRAVEAGARTINDVSAGRHDPEMLASAAALDVDYVAMHMQGTPRDMQRAPRYEDPVADIALFLRKRAHACLKAGIESHKIVLDPGIGFGKRLEHNLEILRRLPELRSLGCPLLMGVSRKSFIAHVMTADDSSGDPPAHPGPVHDRTGGTAAAVTACVLGGADILRVHDVAVMSQAARVASALLPVLGSDHRNVAGRSPTTPST